MKRFQSILVHVDSRDDKHPQLDCAVVLAKKHGAKLKIVDVVPDFSWPVRMMTSEYEEIRHLVTAQKVTTLDALVADVEQLGVAVEGKVLSGKSSLAIVAEVERAQHDLVIQNAKGTASHKPGLFGATATRLVRVCPCTVWLYRIPRSTGPRRVVAAVDPTTEDPNHAELNREILAVASVLDAADPLDVVHVWSVYGEALIKDYMKRDEFQALVKDAQHEATSKLNELLQQVGLSSQQVAVTTLHGAEEMEITQHVNAQGFDVLVIGTVGRSGVTGFLIGNTAESVLERVQCSVVAVKCPRSTSSTSQPS